METGINKVLEKFQREMYTRLTKHEPVFCTPLDENKTALSEGYRLYIYRNNEIYINLDMCKKTDNVAQYLTADGNDHPLEDTRTYIKGINGIMLHKFRAQGFCTYINENYARDIIASQCCKLYARNPHDRIAVQNIITGNTIGIIMPCRYEETNDLDN